MILQRPACERQATGLVRCQDLTNLAHLDEGSKLAALAYTRTITESEASSWLCSIMSCSGVVS